MQSLAYGLVDDVGWEVEKSTNSGSCGWAQMSDVVDLVLVQADALDQVDLDFVSGSNTVDQVLTADSLVLCNSQNRWDVVTWVGVFLCQEGVVEVEFTNGDTVCPCRPFR